MIHNFDQVLHELFRTRVPFLGSPPPVLNTQIGFQPPDAAWRAFITTLAATNRLLNVYLVDIRENRTLRTNERDHAVQNGIATDQPAPALIDCHYLITGWSQAVDRSLRAVEEHVLLAQVVQALMDFQPMAPRAVFDPNPLPAGFPVMLGDSTVPTVVVPAEGFLKHAEFWGTMGATHPWKPAVYLIATLPVRFRFDVVGPIVTTRIATFGLEVPA